MIQSRRDRSSRKKLIHEINITPFVDVILILLVIFMIGAPLMTVGVPIELPKHMAQPLAQKEAPLTLSIHASGALFIQEMKILPQELEAKLKALSALHGQETFIIRADHRLNYGKIMEIMTLVQRAGFSKLALLSDPSNASSH